MPILRLNADAQGLSLHKSPASASSAIRQAALTTGPVVVMLHGFKYDHTRTSTCPHSIIFGPGAHPDFPHLVQWPRHLGFGAGDPDEGLAIAFGWRARGNIWRAARTARAAGRQLAQVIRTLKQIQPDRPLHIISHSMGSEVAFSALHHLHAGDVDRIIALSAASYRTDVKSAMTTPAGAAANLINVISRENDVFDFMYERLMRPPAPGDVVMGEGLDLPQAINIQLDCNDTLAHLAAIGAPIGAPQATFCHWSSYTRPGALRLYNAILRRPERFSLARLRAGLPDKVAPRYSRLIPWPGLRLPLPAWQKAAS